MASRSKIKKLFWPPAVTVDVVIFTIEAETLKVLLIRRAGDPYAGRRALPGGFVVRGETTRDAALRILKEKTGVLNVYLEQLYTFDSPSRDPRGHVLTVSYFALVPREKIVMKRVSGTQAPTFYSARSLPTLAFDHREIVHYALERLRAKLEYTNIVFSLLPPRFTFPELQGVYEIVLGKRLDKRNFRKKFLSLELIWRTKSVARRGGHRPAQLYQFISRRPTELKKFF